MHDRQASSGVLQHFDRVRVIDQTEPGVGVSQQTGHRVVVDDAEIRDVLSRACARLYHVAFRAGAGDDELGVGLAERISIVSMW